MDPAAPRQASLPPSAPGPAPGVFVSVASVTQPEKLAIVGFGTMGQAICHGMLDAGRYPPEQIHPADRHTEALTRVRPRRWA